jgi:gamma-glutamyl:cysteine ligase YbdK (ATP-grasp superfamily)
VTQASEFVKQHVIKPELAWHVGVEVERFLQNRAGKIVPRAHDVLSGLQTLPGIGSFSCELSACQVEFQSAPALTKGEIISRLTALRKELETVSSTFDLWPLSLEVAPDDMPLDVYPDPDGRYARIASGMTTEVLRAACQVTGTHVHVGMPSHEVMLKVYNGVIKHRDELCTMGDRSDGRRLRLYRVVAPAFRPRSFASWEEYEEYATQEGFLENPRDCWFMIRMTIHGTIEFRCFGATESDEEMADWAIYCRDLCQSFV